MTTNYDEKAMRTSSIIGYWPLNEESGTVAYDLGPNGYNGVSSGLVRVPATRGFLAPDGSKCAEFDGSASYIDLVAAAVSSATGSQTTGSICAWVAIPEANLAATSRLPIARFAADVDNEIELYFDTTAYRFSTTFNGGGTAVNNVSSLVYNTKGEQQPEWHHIGMTYSTKSLIIYTDGSPSTTADTTSSAWSGNFASALMCVGLTSTTGGNYFKGWMKGLLWSSAELDAEEMADLAEAGP